MRTGALCGLNPSTFLRKALKKQPKMDRPRGSFLLMMDLRKQIFILRDLIDLPTCDGSSSIIETVLGTLKDLHKMYPELVPKKQLVDIKGAPLERVLFKFSEVLKSVGESWTANPDWLDYEAIAGSESSVEVALVTLNSVIQLTRDGADVADEEGSGKESPRSSSASEKRWLCGSPVTPTSVLPSFMESPHSPEFSNIYCSSPLLRSMRVKAVEKLNAFDVKRLSFYSSTRECSNNTRDDLIFEMDDNQTPRGKTPVSQLPPITCPPAPLSPVKIPATLLPLTDIQATPLPTETISSLASTPDDAIPETTPERIPAAPPPPLKTFAVPPIQKHTIPAAPPPPAKIKRALPFHMHNIAAAPPPPATVPSPPVNVQEILSIQKDIIPEAPPTPEKIPATFRTTPGTVPEAPPPPVKITASPPPQLHKIDTVQPTPKIHEPKQVIPAAPPLPVKATTNLPFIAPPPPPPLSPKQNIPAPTAAIPAPPPAPPMKKAAPPPPPAPPMKGTAPPPPPAPPMKGAAPPPPPPMKGAAAAPPPPPGNARILSLNKVQTKLKRSSHMGNLYRILKGKIEGGNKRSPNGRKSASSTSTAGGKQGMADALAEMTKRSAYFQQIEEDTQKYASVITELKSLISSFENKDMKELVNFHSQVEGILENLTDETQVLARFEGFPEKKLEALRMAAALYSKLEPMLNELHRWKFESPVGQLLDKVERYFNKIKCEIDTLDRTKDEEAKKFQSHKIRFDFHILLQIKEAIVDVSSNCMELALKERREAAEGRSRGEKPDSKKACAKMLWRAFQFAFRVYTFAGGHDDRADKLTQELAHEIQTDPQHE